MPLFHCTAVGSYALQCTPVPATVSITVPFMKAHQNMKLSQIITFKNMWVHKYCYFRLLFNIKNIGKISKPPYVILQCTRIEHISSLIYKESPELLIPEASPTVNSQYSACIPWEVILISCNGCRKWYWSHVMSLDFDALENSLSSVQHKFIKVLVVASRDPRFCFVCAVNCGIYGC